MLESKIPTIHFSRGIQCVCHVFVCACMHACVHMHGVCICLWVWVWIIRTWSPSHRYVHCICSNPPTTAMDFTFCLRKEGYQLKDNESTDNKSVYNCNICNVGEIFFVQQLRKLAVNWKRVWRTCVSCMCMVCAFVCVGGWVGGCESFIRDLPPSPSLPHTECGMDEALKEVDSAIQRLFYYGAYADKYGGSVQETTLYGATVRIHEPVGTLGIACPDEFPLLGFVSLLTPAVFRGYNCHPIGSGWSV